MNLPWTIAELPLLITKITNMNLVGDFNGWNAADDAQQMTWDYQDYQRLITSRYERPVSQNQNQNTRNRF